MAGYNIGSDKGKQIASNLKSGESYKASDGSTWTKKSDGSVSVTTKAGNTTDNAWKPSSTSGGSTGGGSSSNRSSGSRSSSNYSPTNDAASNSQLWHQVQNDTSLSAAQRKQYQDALHAANEMLNSGQTYNSKTGTWSGAQTAGGANNYAPTNDAASNSQLWHQVQNDTSLSAAQKKQYQDALHAANVKLNAGQTYNSATGTWSGANKTVRNTNPKVFTKGATDAYTGTITNGHTSYTDANGVVRNVGAGDFVVDAYGRVWRMGEDGVGKLQEGWTEDDARQAWLDSNMTTEAVEGDTENQELYDQIADLQDQIRAYNERAIQAATDEEIAKVKADMENALAQYNQQVDQQAVIQAQNMDNLALRNAAAGDVGGIGQKRYSDQQAAYDAQSLQIQLEAQNLINTTNQLVAQYEAQGQYQLAQAAREYAQAKYNALMDQAQLNYNYDALIDSQRQQADETAYNRALQRIKLGVFSVADAEAIGYSPEDAQRLVLLAQTDPTAAGNEVSRKGGGGDNTGNFDGYDPRDGFGTSSDNTIIDRQINAMTTQQAQQAEAVYKQLAEASKNSSNPVMTLVNNAKEMLRQAKIDSSAWSYILRRVGLTDDEILDGRVTLGR